MAQQRTLFNFYLFMFALLLVSVAILVLLRWLFAKWNPFPAILLCLIIVVGNINPWIFLFFVVGVAFLSATLGTYPFGETVKGDSPYKYLWAFATLFALEYIVIIFGYGSWIRDEYIPESAYIALFLSLGVMPSLAAWLCWLWQIHVSSLQESVDKKNLD
jgi:hypothetical protein